MLSIRRAALADARSISDFGRRAFHDTFAADNTPEDMDAYLSDAFTDARLAREIADAARVTLVGEMDGALVAYAQLASSEPPACIAGPDPIELVRFYVDRAWHGRGIAHSLMRAVEETASARARTLWLGVWEKNPRAIAFYAKCGFADVGSHVFRLGADEQIDRIMVRALPPPTAPSRP